MYRVLRPIEAGNEPIERGTLSDLKGLSEKTIKQFLDLGIIARVAAPPLSVLPGWSARIKKLEKIGVQDADQFLSADDAILASALRIGAERIDALKIEIRHHLTVAYGPR